MTYAQALLRREQRRRLSVGEAERPGYGRVVRRGGVPFGVVYPHAARAGGFLFYPERGGGVWAKTMPELIEAIEAMAHGKTIPMFATTERSETTYVDPMAVP